MPITIAIVAATAKAGCFLIGSLVHEVNELTKRFGVDHEEAAIAKAQSLLIKDEQLDRLQETPKVPSSNALILYASRAVTLSFDSLALESPFDVVENSPFSVLNNLRIFAAWYLARCIALMQSALRSFIPDMKVAISSFFGFVSESVVEKKAVSSILFLIQVNFSRLIAKVVIILKEAIHLLKSRTEKNISTLLGQAFPAGIRGKETALPRCSVVGDSLPVNVDTCTLKNLTMMITCVKQALAILLRHSTSLHRHRPLQLLGVKMTTLVCLLLCVSISVVGWSIPLMLFDGSKLEQGFLQHKNIPEAVLDLEAGALSSITSRLTSLPGDTSNSLISMESISNVVDLHSVSTAMGASDRQADLNRHGLADYALCMLLWQANDFNTASTPGLQSGYLFDDKAAADSLAEWDIDIEATHCIQSGFRSGSALESSLFHSSRGTATATTHFDKYYVSAIVDEAFALSFISQGFQNQSSVELGCFPSRSAPDGDISTMPMMIIIAAGPSEIFIINYLTRENIDGYSDSMHADDRYSDLTAVRVHDVHADMDQYGLADYSLNLHLRSDNDFFTASSSDMHTDYFWNDKAAVALPLDWNIESTHCIQSESSLFYVLGDLSSQRFATAHFASVAVKAFDGYTAPTIADAAFTMTPSFVAQALQNQTSIESLGRSLPRSVSDEDTATSSMSMIVTEVGPPQELSIFQNQERLPAPSDRTSGFAKPKASVSSVSISRPKSFFATAPSSLSFNALKDSTSLNTFCELRQLALVLLMLAYCNSDGITDEPDDAASTSEISPGTDLDLEEAPDDEVIFIDEFIDEENGAETEEAFFTYHKSQTFKA
eukprot:scaffold12646_cov146-Skeletonema_dohrnii-CCMP3373.AAC.3